jgi:hypothetical protein
MTGETIGQLGFVIDVRYALDPSNAERLWDTALGLLPA